MYKSLFILTLLAFAIAPYTSFSQPELNISNYSGKRGETVRVSVYADLKVSSPEKVLFSIRYDGIMLGIADVIAGDEYMIRSKPSINKYWDSFASSWVLEISSSDIQLEPSGKLIAIDFEIYAGEQTFAGIKPFKLLINDEEQKAVYTNGGIEIQDPAVYTEYPEHLEQNHPNPFIVKTVFPFSLSVETSVSFNIFDLRGRKVLDWKYIVANSKLYKEQTEISNFEKERLGKGEYYLDFFLEPWQLASGMYIMVMKTERKLHKINIIVQK